MEGTDRRERARVTSPEGEDRISNLADEILVSILSRLSLREAVGTSVLSKRWRYVWTCIPSLNFDITDKSLRLYKFRDGYNHSKWGSVDRYNYSNWVSSVLAQHRGPNLDEFRICCNLDKAYTSHIDKWIEFALSNRVHTIDLGLSNLWSPILYSQSSCDRCYILQHRVLGLSALNSSNMFVGFKSLKTLSLKAVKVDDEAIEYVLSNCPLLEGLFMYNNHALKNLKVVGPSLMLRYLVVVKCWSIEAIEICDTNLVSFTFAGKVPKMLLKNAPQLVKVSINPNESIECVQAMFPKLSCCFSRLEILQLKISSSSWATVNNIMLPKLKNLKQFELVVNRWYNESPLGYLAMIKNWLNLQRFVLQLRLSHKHDKERKATRGDVRKALRFCHPCLKVVEIEGYCNTCDFELFKQIIKNAVTLEKIVIGIRDPDLDSKRKSEKDYGKLQGSSVEQQLRAQVPPGVELVFKNDDFWHYYGEWF